MIGLSLVHRGVINYGSDTAADGPEESQECSRFAQALLLHLH
jgi:hypothetical protein